MVELSPQRRLEIDGLSKKHPHSTNRLLVAEGVLIGHHYRDYRDRKHFTGLVMDEYKTFMEEGVHPIELGMWVHGIFEWIAQQVTPPVSSPCEVGPAQVQRW